VTRFEQQEEYGVEEGKEESRVTSVRGRLKLSTFSRQGWMWALCERRSPIQKGNGSPVCGGDDNAVCSAHARTHD